MKKLILLACIAIVHQPVTVLCMMHKHSQPKILCTDCDRMIYKKRWEEHKKQVHGQGANHVECHHCNKFYPSYTLNDHIRYMHGPTTVCPTCERKLTEPQWRRHPCTAKKQFPNLSNKHQEDQDDDSASSEYESRKQQRKRVEQTTPHPPEESLLALHNATMLPREPQLLSNFEQVSTLVAIMDMRFGNNSGSN